MMDATPEAGSASAGRALENLGALALAWDTLRLEAKAAKEARAGLRDTMGGCERMAKGESPCWTVIHPEPGEEACPSCKAQIPYHWAYHKAVRKAATALTALRREARSARRSAAKPEQSPSKIVLGEG